MSFEDFIRNHLEENGITISDLLIDIANGNIESQKYLFNMLKEYDALRDSEKD